MTSTRKRLDSLHAAAVARWRTEWYGIKPDAVAELQPYVTEAHRAVYAALPNKWDWPGIRRLAHAHGLATEEWGRFWLPFADIKGRPEALDVTPATVVVPEEPSGVWERLFAEALNPETAAGSMGWLTTLAFARALRAKRAERAA